MLMVKVILIQAAQIGEEAKESLAPLKMVENETPQSYAPAAAVIVNQIRLMFSVEISPRNPRS